MSLGHHLVIVKLIEPTLIFNKQARKKQKWEKGGGRALADPSPLEFALKYTFLQWNNIKLLRKEWIYFLGTYFEYRFDKR